MGAPLTSTAASRIRRSERRPINRLFVAHLLLMPVVAQSCAPHGGSMLETIAVILLVLWLLGIVSGYTLGNFIYVLLVIAIVLFLVRLASGRRV
jgi:uncharacterized membrane protein YjdF